MISELGIFNRKLRLEKGELLYDMAQKLGVSPSFLSRVENGKKKPPIQWKDLMIKKYNIKGTVLEEFEECFFNALNADSIDISFYEPADKELMLSFARQFDTLDKEMIKNLLESRKK